MQPGWVNPIESSSAFSGSVAVVIVFVVGWLTLAPLLFTLWRFFVHRGRAFRAETAEKEPHPVAPGRALLHGTVDTEDGAPAVRIEIDQTGQEWSNKGNYSHRWTEKGRRVSARRFRLRLRGDDTVVMVEPDERVHLVDTLVTEKYEGGNYRRRVAELSHHERVWVSGVLAEEGSRGGPSTAYRSGPGAMVLRGTRTEPLDIASGRLGSQFTHWRKYYRNASIWLGIAVLLVHGLLFGPFYALFWAGQVATCDFTTTSTFITTNKGHSTTHYVLHARLPGRLGGTVVKDEVSRSLYDAANRGEITKVPFIVVPALPVLNSIGEHADLNIIAGAFSIVLGLVAILVFVGSRAQAAPWYEQRKVVESGNGRLDSKALTPAVPGE